MPAGDFTASVADRVKLQLEKMFKMPGPAQAEFFHPVMSAKLVLERQTVEVEPVLQNGKCIGVKAWYLQDLQSSIVHSGTTPRTNQDADCNIPTGKELRTEGTDYDNNLYIEASRIVKDGKCNNLLEFTTESAKALEKAMLDIRKELNTRVINLLAANAQANQYTQVADYITASAGNRLKIAPSNWDFETLAELRLLAENNQIFDPIILNGRNLFTDKTLAEHRKLNSDQKDEASLFNEWDIHWDTRNVDQTTSRLSTFLFSPNVVCFWNTYWNTPVANNIDPANNRWVWTITDPELMYNDNGMMKPITYEVEYQRVCTGRTTHGELKFDHTWFVRLYGGLVLAPSVSNLTGIMEIENLA